MAILNAQELRDYLQDFPDKNLLLDTEDFSDGFLNLCIKLSADEFNSIPPVTNYRVETFPSASVLLQGTLWQIFQSKASLAARNTLSYTDGGLQIPIEEKFEIYMSLAASHKANFEAASTKLKAYMNMESGWGSVSSDEANFPIW